MKEILSSSLNDHVFALSGHCVAVIRVVRRNFLGGRFLDARALTELRARGDRHYLLRFSFVVVVVFCL